MAGDNLTRNRSCTLEGLLRSVHDFSKILDIAGDESKLEGVVGEHGHENIEPLGQMRARYCELENVLQHREFVKQLIQGVDQPRCQAHGHHFVIVHVVAVQFTNVANQMRGEFI